MNIEFTKNVIRMYGKLSSTNYAWRKFCLEHCEFVSAEPSYYCIENEITYDKCIEVILEVDASDSLICKLTMYNGDLLDGYPLDKRAVFFYKVEKYDQLINTLVDKKLMEVVRVAIKKEDDEAFQLRVKNKFAVIINELCNEN